MSADDTLFLVVEMTRNVSATVNLTTSLVFDVENSHVLTIEVDA